MKNLSKFTAWLKETWNKGTKEKVIIVVVVLFVLGILGNAMGGTNDKNSTSTSTKTKEVEEKKEAKVKSIYVTYKGKTDAGTKLDENADFVVTATYDNKDKKEITSGWKVKNPTTLAAEQDVTITVEYEGKTGNVDIHCTTVSEATYKSQCGDVAYAELARNGDNHIGDKVKFTGKIVQVMADGNDVTMRIEVTRGDYDIWDDVVLVAYTYKSGQSKFLEDDIVTFYGMAAGDYTYTSTLGAEITVPSVYAEYIDLN